MENFPLRGEYVFRARFRQGKEVLWLDLDKRAGKVPTDDGAIWLKVKRVGWEQPRAHAHGHRHLEQPRSADGHLEHPKAHAAQSPGLVQSPALAKPAKDPHFDLAGFGPSPTSTTKTAPPQNIQKKPDPMIDLDLDLSGMGTPTTKKDTSKHSANLMEDLLL